MQGSVLCDMRCGYIARERGHKAALTALAALAMAFLLVFAMALPALADEAEQTDQADETMQTNQAVKEKKTKKGNMDKYIGLGKKVAVIATSNTDNAKTFPIYKRPSTKSKVVFRLQGRSCVVCDMRGMKKGKDYKFVKVKLPNCKPSYGYVKVKQFKFGKIDIARFGLSSAKGKNKKRITACKFGFNLVGARYSHSNSISKAVGLDCGQLVRKCLSKAGLHWVHSSRWAVSKKDLKPGDLVFYRGLTGGHHGHVGMYIGNGYVVQSTADRGVRYPNAGVRITRLTFRSSPQGFYDPLK